MGSKVHIGDLTIYLYIQFINRSIRDLLLIGNTDLLPCLVGEAVEAKQIAEQEAKQAEFIALKATKEAEAKVNLAKREAEAHRLLRDGLTPEILQRQAIEKWNGKLP